MLSSNKLMGKVGSRIMKKVIAIVLVLLINICFISNFSTAKLDFKQDEVVEENSILFMVNNPYADVNGEIHLLDSENTGVELVNINGRTLIPLRFFTENFGFEVEWDANEGTATMVKADKTICLKPESKVIKVNESEIQLDVMSQIIQNRLYVPLRNINEIVGKKVSYRNGVILVSDSDISVENYSDKEFAQVYFNFVKSKIVNEYSTKAVTRWEAATYLVSHILSYYNKSIPNVELCCFPDYKDIPKEAYYYCNLAAYLNLLEVEKGDFEPLKSVSNDEIIGALLRFGDILINEPDLNFVKAEDSKKDLLSIVNEIVKSETDTIRISIYDFATEKTLSYNGQERFYPASLTKVANLLCFLEEVQNKNLSLDNTYTLKQSDKYIRNTKVTGTGNLQYQANGTKYTYKDILSRMISLSDNVAANIVFETLGSSKLQSFCERYGLKDTGIYKKYYDGNKAFPSNYTTADDLTRMLVLLENRISVQDNLAVQGIEFMEKTEDKNRIALYAPKDVVIANKIGCLTRLSGDMALVYFPDREPIALTIVVEDNNRKEINQTTANKLIGTLSREIINYYRTENNPSLYVDGNLVQERIGFRFIDNRPFIKENSSLEGFLKEDKNEGKGNYVSLDSLVRDNKCTYSIKEYPTQSISITSKN